MEKYKRPKSSLASHRRRFEPLDMNKSSSSLNMSTSSLRSIGEKTRKDNAAAQGSMRTTTVVKFAPPPKSSSLSPSTKTTSPSVSSKQATARPGTASGPRPGSSAGPRCGTSAGRSSEAGRKATRRSWGLAGDIDATKDERRNDSSAPKMQQVRSSSAPRIILPLEEKEKPSPKRSNKIMTPSRTKNPEAPPVGDTEGSRSPPNIPKKSSDQKGPNIVSLNNTVTPGPARRVTVSMIGASWESLPSDVQSLGLEVMRHRDNAEAAAVEALQEASAAEILLRCLRALADLTSAAAEQSPQQTVDEFLALHAALTSSAAAVPDDDKQQHYHPGARDWLRAAVATDLAPFSLDTTARNSSQSAPLTSRPAATADGAGEETWLDAARRGLGVEMRAWFLGHVERLLDGDVAGTLGQLKRVSEWLDDAVGLLGSESKAVERVRKKIYGFLLDHVESAVVTLNGGAAPGRGRRQYPSVNVTQHNRNTSIFLLIAKGQTQHEGVAQKETHGS